MTLRDHITSARDGIRTGRYVNEASVSQGIVLPFLHALGWPVFDPDIVAPEYTLSGRRVDFALCNPRTRPCAFIEVKQIGQSAGADRQLFEYAFHIGVPMAVLTDGQEWHFYLPGAQGHYQERRVYKLDIVEREMDECERRLRRYLDYRAVCEGRALEAAQKDYQNVSRERQIKDALPTAWRKLIEEQDELLLELLSDRVESICGFRPEPDTVAAFVTESVALLPVQNPSSPPPTTPRPPQPRRSRVRRETTSNDASSSHSHLPTKGFSFNGRTEHAPSARLVLAGVLNALQEQDDSFLERFAALPRHGRSRRYVARTREELYPRRPDLAQYAMRLPSGWWMGTNYSVTQIRKIIGMACEVAGIRLGREIKVRLD
ncbi:hypothetical protein BH23BAC4_BH23BAC4_07570 [soil metagenome]